MIRRDRGDPTSRHRAHASYREPEVPELRFSQDERHLRFDRLDHRVCRPIRWKTKSMLALAPVSLMAEATAVENRQVEMVTATFGWAPAADDAGAVFQHDRRIMRTGPSGHALANDARVLVDEIVMSLPPAVLASSTARVAALHMSGRSMTQPKLAKRKRAYSALLPASRRLSAACGRSAAWRFRARPRWCRKAAYRRRAH